MSNIERSPGIPISTSGLRAGGGERGLTQPLDDLVQQAAEALGDLYAGAPITVRFNSDRLSGGAWLKTSEQDYIRGNAEVGITAGLSPDAPDEAPRVSAMMRRVALIEDWETDFADLEGRTVDTVEEAVAHLRETVVTDFSVLLKRMEVLLERKRARLAERGR